MLDLKKEWSISFAGCGFMGIYYVGAASCVLERVPSLIQDASKICGASAGALMAAVVSLGLPLETCCTALMNMAKEARKSRLGPLHPAYNLLQNVQDSLLGNLPEDAHVRVSGKLCVSLTRVSDGRNVLVSEFDSREELVQALLCSCFVPFYCGVIPPTYRGVHYVDGAISDNLPRCHYKNTITFSAYAGENDICPRASTLSFHQVRFSNVSIQVSSENIYRVTSTFFPPQPELCSFRLTMTLGRNLQGHDVVIWQVEAIAEICHNGYMDALRFLQENNLISCECPLRSLATDSPKPACCDLVTQAAEAEESSINAQQDGHFWLDQKLIENLPVNIKKALCESCREARTAGGLLSNVTKYLPKKVSSYLLPDTLPAEPARSLSQRLTDWIPDVPKDVSWLYGLVEDMYKQAWKDEVEDDDGEMPLRRCTSLPLGLNLCCQTRENEDSLPEAPQATPNSTLTFSWNTHSEDVHMPLTPPPTPTPSSTSGFGEDATESPNSAGGGWGLGRAVGWIRNITSEQTTNVKKTKESVSVAALK